MFVMLYAALDKSLYLLLCIIKNVTLILTFSYINYKIDLDGYNIREQYLYTYKEFC